MALSLASAADRRPGRGELRVLSELALPRGSFTIGIDSDGAYWLDHAYYGTFHVSGDASEIVCAPNELPAWLWQRFLIAQPLPLASLLHGYEPLHASAVGVDGRALILMGTTGSGKSSVALRLAARGGSFLADDVTALELSDDVVLAHPGTPLSSVDASELERVLAEGGPAWQSLGSVEDERRILIEEMCSTPLPVGAVYVLVRTHDVSSIEIGPPVSGTAKALLGGTFNPYVRSPSRLARQLEVASRIAQTEAVSQVRIPIDADAGETADAILSGEPADA